MDDGNKVGMNGCVNAAERKSGDCRSTIRCKAGGSDLSKKDDGGLTRDCWGSAVRRI